MRESSRSSTPYYVHWVSALAAAEMQERFSLSSLSAFSKRSVAFELWVLAHSASSVNLFFRLMDDAQFSSLRAFVCLRGGSGKCPLCLKTALMF
jgi:hypothetical protein